jgi:DNA-binding transcriptional ArsR family regulator
MSQSDAVGSFHRSSVERDIDTPESDETTVDMPEVLSLLSDEYAREVLSVLVEHPLSARELVDRLNMSRATVYRRLDRLESAGVLDSSMHIDPDGHHRKRFHVVVDRIRLAFESDGLTLQVGE